MTKGDMAFFYHSNCKVPGIVGTMEVVEEHSVDSKLTNPRTFVPTSLFILKSDLRRIFLPCSNHHKQNSLPCQARVSTIGLRKPY